MKTDKNTVLAWHFSSADKKLAYGDNRVIKTGSTLKVKGDPTLCHYGLHASVRLIDALANAPGPYLWRVEVGGTIIHGSDKLVGTERKSLWGFDATPMLRTFARQCALDVVHLWDCPDVVRKFLQTGDETLRAAAEDAARAAAWDAARAAAWAATRGAAWAAAWDAAWAAARDAARDAAGDAAGAAAGAIAWDAAGAAAGAIAWDAAWAAADGAQNKRLEDMAYEISGKSP